MLWKGSTPRTNPAVPPTAGLVAKLFGVGNMATLFGIVMLTHQVGGFLGAWLAGRRAAAGEGRPRGGS